jgi:glutathione S-transferase
VRGQLFAGLDALEREAQSASNWLVDEDLMLADITVATTFAFVQLYVSDVAPASQYDALTRFWRRAETLTEFRAAPCEDGVKVAPLVMTA